MQQLQSEPLAQSDKSSLLGRLHIDRGDTDDADDADDTEDAEARPARRIYWKWPAGAALAALIGAATWFSLGRAKEVPVEAAVAQPLVTEEPVSAGSLLDASGYVVARRRSTVASKVTGRVIEVLIEEGRRVEAGEVIARLDDSNYRATVEQAKAQLAQMEAGVAAARTALADAQPIFQRNEKQQAVGVISAQAFDTAKASYNSARTALTVAERSADSARASLVIAQRNLDDTVVRAPFSGVVTEKAAQPGEIVSPMSAGGGFTRTGIGTIVDMDSLEVEVDVGENFINRVHSRQPVIVKLNAYSDWAIPGEVIATIPTADRAKATVKVRIALAQKDPRVIPEMGARVSFLSDEVNGQAPPPENGAAATDERRLANLAPAAGRGLKVAAVDKQP
jgi:HlyD family secretion protein